MSESLVSLLTAVADDELILGHRHSEWTGHAPHIEEDVAFSSIAQDEIGHAAAYYSLISKITGDDPDRIALGRAQDDYRHAIVCERPNRDWAYTLVRHWLYDTADDIRLETLEASAHDGLAAVAHKLRREERYHLLHANTWMRRVAGGPVEGRARLIDSIGDCFEESTAVFEAIEGEDDAVDMGWLPASSAELKARFIASAVGSLDELGLPSDLVASDDSSAEFVASSSGELIARNGTTGAHSPGRQDGLGRAAQEQGGLGRTVEQRAAGGRRGRHSPDFESLWTEMTSTYQSEPGARW